MTEVAITPLIERLVAAGCDMGLAALIVSQAYNVGFAAGAPKRSSAANRCKRWREKQKQKRIENVSNDTPATRVSKPSHTTQKRVETVSNDTVRSSNIISVEKVRTLNSTSTPNQETLFTASPTKQRGSRIPNDWKPSDRNRLDAKTLGLTDRQIDDEAGSFLDYWKSIPGARGCKLDWDATWRNRCRDLVKRRQQWADQQAQREAKRREEMPGWGRAH